MQTDRVVLVTGAAGGVGAELVERFLRNGDTVIATDVTDEALHTLEARVGAGARIITAAADVSQEADCAFLSDIARDGAGRVDVVVNCAGHFPITPFEKMSADEWRRVIDINLTGQFLVIRAMLPLMKDRGWGRLINFGSASVFDGVPGQTHYVAAKAGVVGFSRSLAREVGGYGITVNVVTPGLTVTGSVRRTMPAELIDAQRRQRALKRDEQAADVVGAVFFLASPDADFITGQIINVDGGNRMH